jgi:MFS family permease
VFWVGFILSINRFVRFFSNILSSKILSSLGLRNSLFFSATLGGLSTIGYGLVKGVFFFILLRIVWGISYSILRLSYQLKVFSFDKKDYGKYLGFCLGMQRTGSFIAVTLGVFLCLLIGYETILIIMGLLFLPSFLFIYKVNNLKSVTHLSLKVSNWDLFYSKNTQGNRFKLITLSFMKFTSSFTSNGLAIATITPFLMNVNANNLSIESVILIAGIVVGFRWVSDILLGVIFGSLSDKFGRFNNITLSILFLNLFIIIAIIKLDFFVTVVCLILMFFVSVSLETSLDALFGEIIEEKNRSIEVSKYSTWQDLGAAMGPITGYLIASSMNVTFGYIVSIVLIIIASYMFYIKCDFREKLPV